MDAVAIAPEVSSRSLLDRAMRQIEAGEVHASAGSLEAAIGLGLGRADLPAAGLPDRTILMPIFDWFGFDYAAMTRELVERGVLPCHLGIEVVETGPLPDLAAGSFRNVAHHGVMLWPIVRHDVALRTERTPREIESDPRPFLPAIAREFARAIGMLDRFLPFFDRLEPEGVVIAQGHVLAAAALRALALARDLRVVCIENTFHHGRLVWDELSGLTVNRSAARNLWWRVEDRIDAAEAEEHATELLAILPSRKSEEHAAPRAVLPKLDDSRPTIVFLAQVSTDASVLFGLGPGFRDQVDAIAALATHARELGCNLVVKLHPKEHRGSSPLGLPYRQLTLRKMQEDPELGRLMSSGEIVVDADNRFDTYALIGLANLCVTVNSQAGLEALLHGREVVLCGSGFYGGLGFTHDADDAAGLRVAVERVLRRGVLRNTGGTARKFLHFYLDGYCLKKSWRALVELLAPDVRSVRDARPETGPRDFTYDSGERQTGRRLDDIRRDHRARYEYAAEAIAARFVDGSARGLDVFCGNGYGTRILADLTAARVTGFDGSTEAIEVAGRHFANERTAFRRLIYPAPLACETVDFAVCFESLEHVDDDIELLADLARTLRPGGLLFVSVPNDEALPLAWNRDFFRHHRRHYRRRDLARLAREAGLTLRRTTGQDVYRASQGVVTGLLPAEAMGLDRHIGEPQFLLAEFERD